MLTLSGSMRPLKMATNPPECHSCRRRTIPLIRSQRVLDPSKGAELIMNVTWNTRPKSRRQSFVQICALDLSFRSTFLGFVSYMKWSDMMDKLKGMLQNSLWMSVPYRRLVRCGWCLLATLLTDLPACLDGFKWHWLALRSWNSWFSLPFQPEY